MTAEVTERPLIRVADMCPRHQHLLVTQAQYTPDDAWRALIIVAQIALMQAATCDPATHEKTAGDLGKLEALGCLACLKPDAFGEIVETAKLHDFGKIKALGEQWVKDHGDTTTH